MKTYRITIYVKAIINNKIVRRIFRGKDNLSPNHELMSLRGDAWYRRAIVRQVLGRDSMLFNGKFSVLKMSVNGKTV